MSWSEASPPGVASDGQHVWAVGQGNHSAPQLSVKQENQQTLKIQNMTSCITPAAAGNTLKWLPCRIMSGFLRHSGAQNHRFLMVSPVKITNLGWFWGPAPLQWIGSLPQILRFWARVVAESSYASSGSGSKALGVPWRQAMERHQMCKKNKLAMFQPPEENQAWWFYHESKLYIIFIKKNILHFSLSKALIHGLFGFGYMYKKHQESLCLFSSKCMVNVW